MYGLALHTTTPALGIAICDSQGNNRHHTWKLDRDMSTHLHQCLQGFISPHSWKDFHFMAVAVGPGSFTSTRLGVVTARTLAQQLAIPLYGISSLAALAWQQSPSSSLVAVQMGASRGELFVAIYRRDTEGLTTILADALMTSEVWQSTLQQLSTPYYLIEAPLLQGDGVTSVITLAYLSWQKGVTTPHWSSVIPYYGQNAVNLTANS